MRRPQFSGDLPPNLVADTSVIINLNATGAAHEIIRSLNVKLSASTVVRDELIHDRISGRNDADLAQRLVQDELLQFAEFDEKSGAIFESLVSGTAETTLDDGEAATLALAVSSQGLAIIDERKAIRIATHRFPTLQLLATVDLLRLDRVLLALGNERLAKAVISGLKDARMAIPERHHGWIADLLGDQIVECRSLPAALRRAPA
ncbi:MULTISPECIES: hypothetical protein [Phyllobacteriaceae]|uniref:hypothetical protein n=1 Tax=Phyllobacteriaceae TaxID=69277 RepID=UPI0019296AFD|nr:MULTISPECIES: hypothetical protein [Phyllobacteriaceae]BBD36371.1 hypothetical protein Amn_12510 [Aminobacter sp. SS-2016]BCG82713.1 hypothetical protein MesoLj113b_62550 [Mesorhizobium sp. 113-3-3]BCG90590.1 hypothetical protein MesoLj113c_67000 [Mesorhizobium sp. 113-3-9]BCH18994.1 hypothetical protein MesoLjLa_58450 [Mesorhizobium sp. L-2-11]